MKPSQALLSLLEQHARLRDLAGAALSAAARRLAADGPTSAFHQSIVDLRRALAEHNVCEEAFLSPMLHADTTMGAARVKRMMEEHVAEHAAFRAAIQGDDLEVARGLPDLVEELEAHMQAEERTFLSPAVLRDAAQGPRGNGP
jgi:iron-sulfur cluster repair protein YtfE (RIC family)